MAKPVVDGIERNVGDEAQVLRLDVTRGVGRELAIRYAVRQVPTLLVIDGNGNVVLRQAGTPGRKEVVSTVERLAR